MNVLRRSINHVRNQVRAKHIDAREYTNSLRAVRLYPLQQKTETLFRKDILRLLKSNFIATTKAATQFGNYQHVMDSLSSIKAPLALKESIVGHVTDRVYAQDSHTVWCSLNSVRFITADKEKVSKAAEEIGKTLHLPTLVIDASDLQTDDVDFHFHTFYQKYRTQFLDIIKKEKSASLIIVIHQKDSALPAQHLEAMISQYSQEARILLAEFQKILIIQTAPQSLKTEKEKEEAKNPGEWYIENPKEITLDTDNR